MSKKSMRDGWTDFITDLQAMQTRAHGLGLHMTAKALNEAMNVAGFEEAERIKRRMKEVA